MASKSKNSNMNNAKKVKNDEFYTRLEDVSRELCHYKNQFKDKIVFCNCDDPTWSAFWKYFHLNFAELGLKKLVSTHYDKENPTYKMEYEGGNDSDVTIGVQTPLQGNGDFSNEECVQLLKECDIVVTNPPFSIAREKYVPMLMQHKKKFLIIGDKNWITYKTIFSYLMENRIWIGKTKPQGFDQPTGAAPKNMAGKCYWFTNLPLEKAVEKLFFVETYDPKKYPKYDNYDAIHIKHVVDIPKDYNGMMGVPISFVEKYCKDQFEILDARDYALNDHCKKKSTQLVKDADGTYIGGEKPCFAHLLVRRIDLPYNQDNWKDPNYKISHPAIDDSNPEIEAFVRQKVREVLYGGLYQGSADPNVFFGFMQPILAQGPASDFALDELKIWIADEQRKFNA